MKLKFSRKIFEKILNIKFNENPSSGNPVVSMRKNKRSDGQIDRHDKANSRFFAILRMCLKKTFFYYIYISFYCTTSLITDYKYTYVTINGL